MKIYIWILSLVISICCIHSIGLAEEIFLGKPDTLTLALTRDFNPATDKLRIHINGNLKQGVKAQIWPHQNDKKTVNVAFTIPPSPDYLGKIELRMLEKNEILIGRTAEMNVIAPGPVVEAILLQNQQTPVLSADSLSKIEWRHQDATLRIHIKGRQFFLQNEFAPGLPNSIQFSDPYLRILKIDSVTTKNIYFDLFVPGNVGPGLKEITLVNVGGQRTTTKFELYSLAKPGLKGIKEKILIFTGQAKRINLPVEFPQNVSSLFLAEDAYGQNKIETALIRIENELDSGQDGLPVTVVVGKNYPSAFLFCRTKNRADAPIRLARLSEVLEIKQQSIAAEIIDKYEGEYLESIRFQEDLRLDTQKPYTLISKNNREFKVRYERAAKSLKFEDPPKLTLEMEGTWRSNDIPKNISPYISVKEVPQIKNLRWESLNADFNRRFNGKAYATHQPQEYKLYLDIQNLHFNDFPDSLFDFFGDCKVLESKRVSQLDNITDRVILRLEVPASIMPNTDYYIEFKPIKRIIETVRFESYNFPVINKDFLCFANPGDKRYDLAELKSQNKSVIRIPKMRDILDGVSLNLDSPEPLKGAQYLIVEATLFNDEAQPIGQFSQNISSGTRSVSIKFRKNNVPGYQTIEEWYSVHLKVRHDLSKYSPPLTWDEQENNNGVYLWEQTFLYTGGRVKTHVDITTPVQQSVYIVEDDSVRASLFNVGINWLFYIREPNREQEKNLWYAPGFGIYVSQLDKLADSQFVSLGFNFLLNFNLKEKLQFALGTGFVFEYQFKDKGNQKRGARILPAFSVQLRLPD